MRDVTGVDGEDDERVEAMRLAARKMARELVDDDLLVEEVFAEEIEQRPVVEHEDGQGGEPADEEEG